MESPPLKFHDVRCSIVPDSSLVPRGRACDEDMATIVTPTTPAKIRNGSITRDRPHQLNYPVLSFLGNVSNVYVNMILPNGNIFRLLINEGPGMEKKDDHWSVFKHEDDEDTTVMNMTINFFIFDLEMKSI